MNKKISDIKRITKDYLITIKKIETTKMMVKETSKAKAISKVDTLLNDCIENNVNLSKTFKEKPIFKYHATIVTGNDLSNV